MGSGDPQEPLDPIAYHLITQRFPGQTILSCVLAQFNNVRRALACRIGQQTEVCRTLELKLCHYLPGRALDLTRTPAR